MMKLISVTALVLGLSSGAALADRVGEHRAVVEHRGASSGVVVRDRGWHNGAIIAHDRGWYGGGRVAFHGPGYGYGYARRPIYVNRPYIGARYYNYHRRPELIVENYGPRAGYFWVSGAWAWNGAEWVWAPGHYQPDPSYVDVY
jgi:hypothetical protein